MNQRTRIKICGLTREEDVDAAVAAGADAVGFVLYEPSARYVSAARAAELAAWLPAYVTPVLLFVNATAAQVAEACALLPTALLQFHGDESPADCLSHGRPFVRAARIPRKIRFRLQRSPSHIARRPCRRFWWWRKNIQLVTASSKRQRSPRFVWWIDACKCDRWHFASQAALQNAGR
jgi:hypothetical protein